jgi:Ala-tRNA(Pro) deacylase
MNSATNYTPRELLGILRDRGFEHLHFTHPPVFTTADVTSLPEKIPGADTKNLFLRDEKRTQFALVCVRAETRVNLKELGRALEMKGLTFASPEDLLALLGLIPGAVCLFGLLHDTENKVAGYLDQSIPDDLQMQNHPLVNTETVVLKASDMVRFCLEVAGHQLTRIEVPVRG